MDRYLYYCPKCNSFYSKEAKQPNEATLCGECKIYMKYTGINKTEWDSKTKEEKDLIKKNFQNANNDVNASNDNAILYELKNIGKDVHSLYNITIALIIICIILGFIVAMS